MSVDVQHRDGEFVVERGGERVAEMTYTRRDAGTFSIDHTWVSDALRGEGVGRRLVESAVGWARREGLKIVPICTYAKGVLEREPAFADVLAPDARRGK